MSHAINHTSGWLRLGARGPGFSWTCEPPLFSERYGYRKPIVRIGRWRVFVLRPWRSGSAAR